MDDARSDLRGAAQLIAHIGVLGITGTLLVRTWGTVWSVPLVVAHGVVLSFLFSAGHECVHRTAFRTRWCNDAVAWATGMVLLLPSRWFRLFHAAHHRWTQEPDKDPELDGWKPPSRRGIVLQQTGLLYWKAMASVVLGLVRGRADAPWLPAGHRKAVIRQARGMVVLYVALILGSVVTRSWLVVQLWLLPALVGQPALRWYLLAEHTGLPSGRGVGPGTRTTLTTPVLQFLAWNMPFHSEHHAHPQVPFHRLPALHRRWVDDGATDQWGALDRGYLKTVARLQRERWSSAPR